MKNKEKHDGEILVEVIEKLGMDKMTFGMLAVFDPGFLLKTAESFPLSEKEKQVLNDRINLLK